MIQTIEDFLILTKTYPTPSNKYRETTCVAALNGKMEMRRLYPIPFRLLDGVHQFKKWEWIRAAATRAKNDLRPESHHIDADSIARTGKEIDTKHDWEERRRCIEPHIVENYETLERRREATGQTLGFIRPHQLLRLEITAVKDADWTDEEKAQLQKDGLFDSEQIRSRPHLRKLPFDFHYHYECSSSTGTTALRHKLTDWEVGALYWTCTRDYGAQWEKPFRQKLELDFAKKDLLFLMGTMHRFPGQWLIVGLIYPPKPKPGKGEQIPLLP